MKELEQRILRDGQDLGNGILKVDSFVNHQVYAALLDLCGQEFARRFSPLGAPQVSAGARHPVVPGNPRGSSGYGQAHGTSVVGDAAATPAAK